MSEPITFDEAIQDSEACTKRHLLLGNGFSIACKPDIFTYRSLFEEADFSETPELPEVFNALNTSDFEHVIKFLRDASRAVTVYEPRFTAVAEKMARHTEVLKDVLIRTVADKHPNVPDAIQDRQFRNCRRFLANFLGASNSGKVYTLNYDLLLYWALMHRETTVANATALEMNDGFGSDGDSNAEFVTWMGESAPWNQRVHYLHGALHLFDAGVELQKYTWSKTDIPLIEQSRDAMGSDKFPLFVAEGDSGQKLAKIKHSAYLYHSYKSFSQQMKQRNNALFIFGHSLGNSDEHVLKKIRDGKIEKLYVSIFGDIGNDENKEIVDSASALSDRRAANNGMVPLRVKFYNAESAHVWRYEMGSLPTHISNATLPSSHTRLTAAWICSSVSAISWRAPSMTFW